MKIKNILKVGIFLSLCGWYINYLYKNPKGILFQNNLTVQNEKTHAAILELDKKIDTLKTKIIALQANEFEQEKIIREDLQMSYTNEYVYIIPQKK